ncbi:MAG: ABC transporter ATP-binding protein [Sporichthyaceae bacterium]|nr:ABC transporter ATP-binding protein [Sporichthyaceae bacterium]
MSEIGLANVSRWYGNLVAVNDISMRIGPGVTGLLGPNGAGKTTLLNMLAGFLAPSKGSVTVDGEATWANLDLYKKIGFVPEREAVFGYLTGWEFVHASARLHKLPNARASAQAAIELVDLVDAANRKIETYSKGMRQRVRVAAALVHRPSVLLLDEPFNGMDPRQRLHLMDVLRRMGEAGHTVLYSSHILEEVERLASTVQVMVTGRLAASGDFRSIRRLMTHRPHAFTVRSSDDRRLAAALVTDSSVAGVTIGADALTVSASDYGTFTRLLPKIARAEKVRLREVLPTDESLESVFSYLVAS